MMNLFDHIYELRDGSGIRVLALQYGSRRGFFLGFSKSFSTGCGPLRTAAYGGLTSAGIAMITVAIMPHQSSACRAELAE